LVVLLIVFFILTYLILELGFSNHRKCSLPRHVLEDHPLPPCPSPSLVPLQHGSHRGKEIKTSQQLGFILMGNVSTSESFETLITIKHTWILDKLLCHDLLVADTGRKPEKNIFENFLK
jgi:hypothetical protein